MAHFLACILEVIKKTALKAGNYEKLSANYFLLHFKEARLKEKKKPLINVLQSYQGLISGVTWKDAGQEFVAIPGLCWGHIWCVRYEEPGSLKALASLGERSFLPVSHLSLDYAVLILNQLLRID